jgi:uncharacterized protein with PIN domain
MFQGMDSPHISKERLQALMFATVHLTEEEDAHIVGWRCPECKNAILEIALNRVSGVAEERIPAASKTQHA